MKRVSSFSNYFLIKAASQYVYEMSYLHVYKDPFLTVSMNLKNEFLGRFVIEKCEPIAFKRDGKRIDIRYLLIKDVRSDEYALIYQGSEGSITEMFSGEDNDWSNNLNSAAHLPLLNYDLAKAEFDYLKYEEGYNITALSGNSLGGGYALYVADFYDDVKAIGLNAAPREFTARFKKNDNARLVLTSSDVLSRSLSLDLSRLKGEQTVAYQSKRNIEDRIEDAYGVKPYIIKRSIPYASGDEVSIGHVGAMRNYRKSIMKLYNENFIYYNANIITKHKEWKSFSKYLVQTAYRQLDQQDYRIFTEEYIYPSLTDNAKGIVDTFMYYPQLEDFMSFDLKTMNLIDKQGKTKDADYQIEDHFDFINNLNTNIEGYRKSKSFLIDNSIYELRSTTDDAGFSFNKKQFISSTLKLSLDWDWMFAKMFMDMPLPVKLKTGEFLEQNLSFVYRLNTKFSEEYKIAEVFSDVEVLAYIQELLAAFSRLKTINEEILKLSETISSNMEMMLIEGKHSLIHDHSLYTSVIEERPVDFSDLNHLDKHIMDQHFEAAKAAVLNTKDFAKDNIVDIAATLTKVLEVILSGLELEKEKSDEASVQKLHMQTKALLENIDLESFLLMALHEYQDDIITFLLRDSVAITVQYNLIQMLEANMHYRIQLFNLELYVKENLNQKQVDYLNEDLDRLSKLIDYENKQLKNILK